MTRRQICGRCIRPRLQRSSKLVRRRDCSPCLCRSGSATLPLSNGSPHPAQLFPAFQVRSNIVAASFEPNQRLLNVIDAHAHILAYGQSRQLDVRECQSPEGMFHFATLPANILTNLSAEVVVRVREYILSHPDVRNDRSSGSRALVLTTLGEHTDVVSQYPFLMIFFQLGWRASFRMPCVTIQPSWGRTTLMMRVCRGVFRDRSSCGQPPHRYAQQGRPRAVG